MQKWTKMGSIFIRIGSGWPSHLSCWSFSCHSEMTRNDCAVGINMLKPSTSRVFPIERRVMIENQRAKETSIIAPKQDTLNPEAGMNWFGKCLVRNTVGCRDFKSRGRLMLESHQWSHHSWCAPYVWSTCCHHPFCDENSKERREES